MGIYVYIQASLVAQMVKNLPAMQETSVPSLGWEDLLEEGTAIHSSISVLRIPRTEEPGGLYSMGSQTDMTERLTHTHTHTHVCIHIADSLCCTVETNTTL